MTMPSEDDVPLEACPPPQTENGMSFSTPNLTAVEASCTVVGLTTAAWTSFSGFHDDAW